MKIKSNIGILVLLSWATLAGAQTVETVTTNGLFEPYGVAVDLSTNVYYFSDSANNRIVKFNPANGDQAALADNFLYSPQGIVVARGGLVVAEAGSHLISFVSFDGDAFTLAGSTRGLANGPAASAKFNAPAGLAVDDADNIYIADSKNNVVRLLAPDDPADDDAKKNSGHSEHDGVFTHQ